MVYFLIFFTEAVKSCYQIPVGNIMVQVLPFQEMLKHFLCLKEIALLVLHATEINTCHYKTLCFLAAEVIVNYLASHILLVFNEAKQREIIKLYNSVTKDLPDEKRQRFSLDSTLPDDYCKFMW